jgi:hypothetical protein
MRSGDRFKSSVWIRGGRIEQLVRLLHEAGEITRDLAARRRHLAYGMTHLSGGAAGALVTDIDFRPGGRGVVVEFELDGFDVIPCNCSRRSIAMAASTAPP